MRTFPIKEAYDDAMAQLEEYHQRRAENPSHFGNDLFGAWDGTPEKGPTPLICHSGSWMHPAGLVWCVHKYTWPLDYIYCFGKAWESRGERTDPLLTIDIRDLPKEFIGRFKLQVTSANGHHRKAHRTVLGRAFAANFDFAAHARTMNARDLAEVAARKERDAQLKEQRQQIAQNTATAHDMTGKCAWCGNAAPLLETGICTPCDDEIPF